MTQTPSRCDRHRFVVLPKRWIVERTLACICTRAALNQSRYRKRRATGLICHRVHLPEHELITAGVHAREANADRRACPKARAMSVLHGRNTHTAHVVTQ
jgi:hypothetical protein